MSKNKHPKNNDRDYTKPVVWLIILIITFLIWNYIIGYIINQIQ